MPSIRPVAATKTPNWPEAAHANSRRSLLAADLVIDGDVTSDGPVDVHGKIVGSASAPEDLVIQGHLRTFCPLSDRPAWNRDETGRQPYDRRSAKKRSLPGVDILTGSTQVLITVIKRSTLSITDRRAHDQR